MVDPTPGERQSAQGFLRSQIQVNVQPGKSAVMDAYADGYVSGALATSQQIPNAKVPDPASMVLGPDLSAMWDDWAPGDIGAADLLDAGGFASLLDSAGITIAGVADTMIDRMGSILAEGALNGDSVDSISARIFSLIGDVDRAYTIANTELNRAVSQASMDTYLANGVREWEWVLSPGACKICQEREGHNPQTMSSSLPPAHPNCRCAASPVDPGYTLGEEGSPS